MHYNKIVLYFFLSWSITIVDIGEDTIVAFLEDLVYGTIGGNSNIDSEEIVIIVEDNCHLVEALVHQIVELYCKIEDVTLQL